MEWGIVIGANIRRLRKKIRLSQEALALNAELDLRYLGGIERGEQNPSVAIVGRLAEALGVHPKDLFDESVSDTSAETESD